jgi:hypothetical protein
MAGPWVSRGAHVHGWQDRGHGIIIAALRIALAASQVKPPLQLCTLRGGELVLWVHDQGARAPGVAGQQLQEPQEACACKGCAKDACTVSKKNVQGMCARRKVVRREELM